MHPGPGPRVLFPGELSIEFANIGGWLTFGDLALDSCAEFLAVAEHRSIPSRARSICHQLRRAGFHLVWAPACQDRIAGGHAEVGIVSLGGASLSFTSFITPQFHEFFKLGRAMRTTLSTAQGGVVHLFVVHVYQGAEDDAENCNLLIGFSRLFLLKPRWFALVSPCLLLVILILILRLIGERVLALLTFL